MQKTETCLCCGQDKPLSELVEFEPGAFECRAMCPEDYDDPVRVAYDNAKDAAQVAEYELMREIDLNIDREDADGMMQDWQERAHKLGIPDVAHALRNYRLAHTNFGRVLEGKELPF